MARAKKAKKREKPKVLIAESNTAIVDSYRRQLGRKVTILHANAVREAEAIWRENPDIAVMVFAASLETSWDAVPLVKELRRRGVSCPMIATSIGAGGMIYLLQAGCDLTVRREDVPREVLLYLGL